MQLIYFAPLAWQSFAQRPHMFVRWFHQQQHSSVLWVNPYPTRFPALKDLKRIHKQPDVCDTPVPEWLTVISPSALPIEPLPGSMLLNRFMWQPCLQKMHAFSRETNTLLAIGKPSALALLSLKTLAVENTFYDVMDDYPEFYSGLSRLAFAQREQQIVAAVKVMAVSSTQLHQKWLPTRDDIKIIRNGLMPELFLPAQAKLQNDSLIFGYVGTIAQWFDWQWLIKVAEIFSSAKIRLIGPVYTDVPANLPSNIELLPACDHVMAIAAMKHFDLGLIPFKQDQLTASVDPIKFYEYRALGIAVVSTAFGEMLHHQQHAGVFIANTLPDIKRAINAALAHKDSVEVRQQFIANNSWENTFSKIAPWLFL